MEAVSAAQDDSPGANPSSAKSDDSSPRPDSRTGSPPPNCAICLGSCKNKSFTDSCLHQFCFSCLLTWSKVKAVCPLCKQVFRSIIHNVKSNHQYEEYLVQRQSEESASSISRIDIDRVTASSHRFRYRTTLTLPRRESFAIQQLLRHYTFMTDTYPPPSPIPIRIPSPSPSPSPSTTRHRRSPAAYRRTVAFRSTVYRHNLWARPLPDFTGRFRTCTPEFYRYNSTQMHRLAPWLARELQYLLNENAGHIEYVQARIIELLPQYHINSVELREALLRYFGIRTEHFLHELYCFASTPYDITGYDYHVQYTTDRINNTMINEVISSSDTEASVDSDIVMISSSEPVHPPPGPSRFPVPAYPQSYISQPTSNIVIPIETISQSDSDDDSSEVMVVGYIKPPQERTPEIVDLLGSDSDVIIQENPQPEPIEIADSQEPWALPVVKISLKQKRSEDSRADMSDSDADYRPHWLRASRRCRRWRAPSATCTSYSTPPSPGPSSDSCATPSPSSAPTSSFDDDTDDSRYVVKKKSKKKSSKESATSRRDRRRNKNRPSHTHHKKKKNVPSLEKDKRSKRKSYSGKGVKSSNKTSNNECVVPAEQALPAFDQPSTSGTSKKDREKRKAMKEWKLQRRDSRENRRLRSVVNVMYNSHNRNTDESNSSANYSNLTSMNATRNRSDVEPLPAANDSRASNAASHNGHGDLYTTSRQSPDSSSDSEDNLPLNLTLQKLNQFSSS